MDSLSLPAEVRASLTTLALLPENDFSRFQAALAAVPLSTRRRDFIATVASAASPASEKTADVEGITSAVMYLLGFPRSRKDLSRFIDDVVSEIQVPSEANMPPDLADNLRRLLSILRIDSLRLRAEASELIFEDAKLFQSSRIITDIRPVFDGKDGLHIGGGLIVHNLKIQFLDAAGTNEVYISMDDDDVSELKLVIERAQRKADVLRALLRDSNIIDLNPGESGNHA